jgi:prephenate dehydratase
MKIGYQGIKGAFSEAAIYRHFGKDAEAISYDTSEDVFEALEKHEVGCAVLPFENTMAGSIVINYDLLLKHDMQVIAEVFLPVKHNLLANKGAKLKDIKNVFSHNHALEQCRKFITSHKFRAIFEYDTAGAAKIVKERGKKDEAAIASEFCAEIYGLDVLEKNIELNQSNTTKFFVILNKSDVPEKLKKEKTTIAFRTKHYPGALISCLQRLAKHDINLTKLESRPIPETPWEYMFYVDFDGGIDDENVKLALSEMEASSLFLKVLGSYPKGKL